jgi:hypothetical protein
MFRLIYYELWWRGAFAGWGRKAPGYPILSEKLLQFLCGDFTVSDDL